MEWKVPFIDYPTHFRSMEDGVMEVIRSVLAQGDLILRRHLRDFEEHFAEFIGTRYAVGVSNCTEGLRLALIAAGVGTGDEVITPAHTFVATAAAIHHVGARPVLVDVGTDHNLDPDALESSITPKTKAILPVHLNGRLCDMARVVAVAELHRLTVIEDAAQAIGASYDRIKGGAFGLAGCFSFYPAKLLGTFGDAGAVVTTNPEVAERIRRLRDHGRTPDGDIAEWSFNSRMDNLHAAILDFKLQFVPPWIARRREIAARYHAGLAGLSSLTLPPPPTSNGLYFDVFQNFEIEAEHREALTAHLKANGIEILLPWGGRALHQWPALNLKGFRLPKTDRLFRRVLMLPMYPELSDAQVQYVVDKIREFAA